MKKKKRRIPLFKSVEEEAHFWDTHDFTDYEDELTDVDILFEVDAPHEETLVLRVRKDLKNYLQKEARMQGLNVSTLARMWLMEKIRSEYYKATT